MEKLTYATKGYLEISQKKKQTYGAQLGKKLQTFLYFLIKKSYFFLLYDEHNTFFDIEHTSLVLILWKPINWFHALINWLINA